MTNEYILIRMTDDIRLRALSNSTTESYMLKAHLIIYKELK